MLDGYPISPGLRKRLWSSPIGDHVDGFMNWLQVRGHRPKAIVKHLRALARWCDWLKERGFLAEEGSDATDEFKQMLEQRGQLYLPSGAFHPALSAARKMVRYLQEQDVVARPARPRSPGEVWPLLGEYESWVRQHRGLKDRTIRAYRHSLVGLLEVLGERPELYTALSIREFVLERARPHGVERARVIAASVRSFLRYLALTRRCSADLEWCIPGFASWKLRSIPRHLCPEDVERIIAAADVGGARGLRNRAMALLLARLGLRTSDVSDLKITDLDWKGGRLAVAGKGRRQEWLPLPQEVGDAILEYLRRGRPHLESMRLFTTISPPIRPLTRYGVRGVVRLAVRRAGVDAPSDGPHMLRHSCATNLLRNGASLGAVAAVLRHRHPTTTMLYAKVDFDLLRTIAQPWPGASS